MKVIILSFMGLSVLSVVFREKKSEVLLVKRRDVPVWVLPGGGVDPRESPKKAAERELLEETGFSLPAIRCVAEYIPKNRLGSRTLLFECAPPLSENLPLKNTDECEAIHFFPLDALPKDLFHIHKDWIHDALSETAFKVIPIYQLTWTKLFFYLIKHPLRVFRFALSRLGIPWNRR